MKKLILMFIASSLFGVQGLEFENGQTTACVKKENFDVYLEKYRVYAKKPSERNLENLNEFVRKHCLLVKDNESWKISSSKKYTLVFVSIFQKELYVPNIMIKK